MNILIVDDEQVFLDKIKETVLEMAEEEYLTVSVDVEDDPVSVVEDEDLLLYDLILLDIDMESMSGFEVARIIKEKKDKSDKPYIIFVSNYDNLVFEALNLSPLSFVRKSHLEDLRVCLIKADECINRPDSYLIKVGREPIRLFVGDIMYLEKQKNYVVFFSRNGVLKERTTMDEKYEDLARYGFLRTQIGYLVNPLFVEDIRETSIRLSTGKIIPLSKKYKKTVKQDFYEWMVGSFGL